MDMQVQSDAVGGIQSTLIEKIDEGVWHVYGNAVGKPIRSGMHITLPDGHAYEITMVMGDSGPAEEVAAGNAITAMVNVQNPDENYFKQYFTQNQTLLLAVE